MRANGTFTAKNFTPAELVPTPAASTGTPVGVAMMEKNFEGEVVGHSSTLFTAAFDQATGVGTYLAMESFAQARCTAGRHLQLRTLGHDHRQRPHARSSSPSFPRVAPASWPVSPAAAD